MDNLKERMPVLFIGHGSPMNAVEDNEFTKNWERIASQIPKPKAILSVSAHWYTKGTRINDSAEPKMIYDMYGFPDELYQVVYPAKGAPELAHQVRSIIGKEIIVDNSWGIDHGTWSVLCKMYPQADIPVFQLSVDAEADAEVHLKIGKELSALREQGVLIFGSGNVVHNLSRLNWEEEGGYSWAKEFDGYIKENIRERNFDNVIHYETAGKIAAYAFPTPDHFYPLLYVLGASLESDKLTVFNDSCVLGSLSMTGYLFHN